MATHYGRPIRLSRLATTARAVRAGLSENTLWAAPAGIRAGADEARCMDELLQDFLTETGESLDRVDA
ncbi:MAG: hypothetical protein WBD90_18120, partial [Xanthobacteraceae bacterium]